MKTFKITFDNWKYKQPLSRRDWSTELSAENENDLKEKIKNELNLNPFYVKFEEIKSEEIKALLLADVLSPLQIASKLEVSHRQVIDINENLKY